MSSPMAEAEAAALEAQLERWPGTMQIGEEVYEAAVTELPASAQQYLGGDLAEGGATFRVRKCELETAPVTGTAVEDGEGEHYAVSEVSGDSAGWTIRAAKRGSKR